MREQNLRQRLAIRGSDITERQNISNGLINPTFDTTFLFFRDRLDNPAPVDIRHEEPMENDHARNYRCFKCKKTDHRARFCKQNKPQVRSRPQINKPINQNRPVHTVERSSRSPVECWNCGKVGHVRADCWSSRSYQRTQQNRGRMIGRQNRSRDTQNENNERPTSGYNPRSLNEQNQEN